MDKRTVINALTEGLKEELTYPLDLFQRYLKNKNIPKEEFKNAPFHPAIISLYLYTIEQKGNNRAVSDLMQEVRNKAVFPCVLFQAIIDEGKELDKELIIKGIDCIKTIFKLLEKVNDRVTET